MANNGIVNPNGILNVAPTSFRFVYLNFITDKTTAK